MMELLKGNSLLLLALNHFPKKVLHKCLVGCIHAASAKVAIKDEVIVTLLLWDHSFSTYSKFSEKLTFLTP